VRGRKQKALSLTGHARRLILTSGKALVSYLQAGAMDEAHGSCANTDMD
jgi:hypothetical protein